MTQKYYLNNPCEVLTQVTEFETLIGITCPDDCCGNIHQAIVASDKITDHKIRPDEIVDQASQQAKQIIAEAQREAIEIFTNARVELRKKYKPLEAEHRLSGLVREAIDFREGKLPWVVIEKRCIEVEHKDKLRCAYDSKNEVAIAIEFPGMRDKKPSLCLSQYSSGGDIWPVNFFPTNESAYEYVIALYRSGEKTISEVYDCLGRLPEEYIKANLPEIAERREILEKRKIEEINKEIQQLQKEIERLHSKLPK